MTVTISSKFQLVIPKEVRETLNVRVGMKCEVFAIGDRIEVVPLRPMRELKGFLKGMDTTIEREPDRI